MQLKVGQHRHTYAFELAFLTQHIEHDGSGRSRLSIAEQVDHIIQVAWARALCQRPHLLSKQLFVRIGENLEALRRRVRIGVKDRDADRREDNPLVGSQVQFDARQIAGCNRTTIADLSLTRLVAARVGVNVELLQFGGDFDAGAIMNPCADFTEGLVEESIV